MPIYSSKDLIQFVNNLEQQVLAAEKSVASWDKNKNTITSAVGRIDGINANTIQALVKADEALSEIGGATFTSTAIRGKRLDDVIKKMKADLLRIIAEGTGGGAGGGGGALTEGVFFDELNNAIADVDSTIQDGLKLDYRIREIYDMSLSGSKLSERDIYLPHKLEVPAMTSVTTQGEVIEGQRFVQGVVTVLDQNQMPVLDLNGELIVGFIDETGFITLTEVPHESVILYYPVEIDMKDIPKDFVYLFFNMLLDKTSPIMKTIVTIDETLNQIQEDLTYMKGVRWTPDFSIMRNHEEIVKEIVTPKGVHVRVENGQSVMSFSYTDNDAISHFVAEYFDEVENKWIPVNDDDGVISK